MTKEETLASESGSINCYASFAEHVIDCAWRTNPKLFKMAANEGCNPQCFADGFARICERNGLDGAAQELRDGLANNFIAAKFGYL